MHHNRCRNGHTIQVPGDRRSNGHCAKCARSGEDRYRRSLRSARQRLAAIEALIA
jgi:hypothetical protein